MRLILGIGNPGRRYSNNRHNVGFMFLDYIAVTKSLSFSPSKNDYYFAEGKHNSEFILIKPSTYVNNSGIVALQALQIHNVKMKDLLVVVDDLNLEISRFRVRASGGDGGHNGLSSIIYNLNSNLFPRLRIGINSDYEKINMTDFVLSDFNDNEMKSLQEVFKVASKLTDAFIEGGTKKMMDINSRLKDPDKNNDSSNQYEKGRI